MSNQTKPIILFDVDKTLIDTSKLFRHLILTELAAKTGLSADELNTKENEYIGSLPKYTDFDPINFLRFVTGEQDIDDLASKTVFNPLFHQQSVFADAKPLLSSLQTRYRLGIFSEAVQYWQERKLALAGLTPFFEPDITFIWRRKTDPAQLALLPTPVVIIDDNPDVIVELENVNGVTPIWINRINSPAITNATTITTLTELPTVLSNVLT